MVAISELNLPDADRAALDASLWAWRAAGIDAALTTWTALVDRTDGGPGGAAAGSDYAGGDPGLPESAVTATSSASATPEDPVTATSSASAAPEDPVTAAPPASAAPEDLVTTTPRASAAPGDPVTAADDSATAAGSPVAVLPAAGAAVADPYALGCPSPAGVEAVTVIPGLRRIECLVDDTVDYPALWASLRELTSAEWTACVLTSLGGMARAHEQLRGTPLRVQGWWHDDDSGVQFTADQGC